MNFDRFILECLKRVGGCWVIPACLFVLVPFPVAALSPLQLSIQSPLPGQRFTNWPAEPAGDEAVLVEGLVNAGNLAVRNICLQLNGGEWIATSAQPRIIPVVSSGPGLDGPRYLDEGPSRWELLIHPSAGINVLKVYAVDLFGNLTATQNLFFICVASGTLDTVSSFAPLSGTYSGLFTNVNGAELPGSGLLVAALNSRGVCTARFTESGRTHTACGRCSADGMLALNFGSQSNILAAELQLDLSGALQLTGAITGSDWTSRLMANRHVTKTNSIVQAGRFTVVLAPGDNSTEPGGYGYGAVRVNSNGNVAFSGSLGDGTPLTQAGTLSANGQYPLYAAPYSRRGTIAGWLQFTNAPDRDIDGLLIWTKPARSQDRFYSTGFTNQIEAEGSALATGAGHRALDLTNGVLILESGNLPASQTNPFVLKPNSTGSGRGVKNLVISHNGLFSGTAETSDGRNKMIRGAVLQKQNIAYGMFAGTNQTGGVVLQGK